MSWGYMLFAPSQLPLTPDALSEETVHKFTDAVMVQAALSADLPRLTWGADPEGALARGEVTEDDAHYEFTIRIYEPPATPGALTGPAEVPKLIVSMRCSGRIDSAAFVQRLCDGTGWIAFDDRAYLFQPYHPPMPGGR